jgi:hypothetical protein
MKLTIADCLNLEIEIAGFKNNEGKVLLKGLLNEPLNLKTKYWLNRLVTKLQAEKKAFNDSRDSLIKELGEEQEDGSISIPMERDGKQNPNIVEFNKQAEELLNQEIEIDVHKFSIDNFDFDSDSNYPTFMLKCIHDEV